MITNLLSWAWGSLAPQPLGRFNVHQALVGNDCVVGFLDRVFILRFGPGLEPGADTLPESLIEPIAGAYALLEGIAFDYTLFGGMELGRGQWENIQYGKRLGRHDDNLPAEDAQSGLCVGTVPA